MNSRTAFTLPMRIEDDTWSFRGEHSTGYTHRFHAYPAMMLPQIARRLIAQYAFEGATVLDPFCGSGSMLVEANIAGCNAWGFDINPLAILIARVKSTPLDPDLLMLTMIKVLEHAASIPAPVPPEFFNIEYWFKPDVARALTRLHLAIARIEDVKVREFFAVVFSEVVRLSSNSRSKEFKLYRYSPARLASHRPDPLEMFRLRSLRNIGGMDAFCEVARRDRFVRPTIHNSMLTRSHGRKGPRRGSVDLVITSPPYGDSRTTVAYGQFSRLSLQFLDSLCDNDFSDSGNSPLNLDRRMLGGARSSANERRLASPILDEAIEQIAAKDATRARDVAAFYADLSACLHNIVPLVARNGVLCFVIGNRQVKGVQLETDYIIAEMGADLGLTTEGIIVRSIPTKRMPLRNSPSNRAGEVADTMHREYILVMRKT